MCLMIYIKKNTFATTVETDFGFCFPGPVQSPVYCGTVYTCSGSCSETRVGDACDNESYSRDFGRRVRPKVVDQSTVCPLECLWVLDDLDPIDGPL